MSTPQAKFTGTAAFVSFMLLPLPADERRIFRLLRATEPDEQEAVRAVLHEFWELGPDGWVNARATKELSEWNDGAGARSEKAKAAAAARWGHTPGKPKQTSGDATEHKPSMPGACSNGAGEMPSHSQTPEPEQKKESDSVIEADFDAWWQHAPRKVAKGQARKAYKTALKKTDADTLLAGIKRYAAGVRGKDPEFIRYPATWPNGEGWLDEDAPPPAGKRQWWMDAPLPAHAREPTA